MIKHIFLVVFLIGFSAQSGWAWYNDQFEFRRTITIDTTPLGADISENLTDVPVLIRLHSGNFDFTRVKVDGKDLRFVAADDNTVLKYYIEKFDTLEELAFIWVRVPKISGTSNTEYFYIYYGNESAADSQSPNKIYAEAFSGVFHFAETEGIPQDFSTAGNFPSEFKGGLGFPGVVGNGVTFNGMDDRMIIPGSPSFNFSKGFSFSAWVKISGMQDDACLFYQETVDQKIIIGIEGSKVYASVLKGSDALATTDRSLDLPLNSWHHLSVVILPNYRISIYLDGVQMGWTRIPFNLVDNQGTVTIGSKDTSASFYAGDMDEVQISNISRDAEFIRVLFASQGADSNLLTFSEEVTGGGGGMPTFYLGTVLKNITIDGWAVIGSLMILSVLSWIIFISKTYFLILMERENREFLDCFDSGKALWDMSEGIEEYPNSPLFKVYLEGCRILNKYIGNDPHESELSNDKTPVRNLSKKEMNMFKASLEKGFIIEGKRLSSGLVVLTMSISGGPFLGLLGTVWGVMNTFAAMAEAGEANIMAIAPGVASALSTTVVGLIVAIPALFAYNYLAGKVKGLVSDLSIFVDDFSVKVDEKHGGE